MRARGTEFGQLLLSPHPASPPTAIEAVTCALVWQGAGHWVADFLVAEPPSALTLPEAAPPDRADGLWQTTCFEMFLRRRGQDGYIEFNFSPSGRWAAYQFDGYRSGARNLEVATPWIMGLDPVQRQMASYARFVVRGMDPNSARTLAREREMNLPPPVSYFQHVSLEDETLQGLGPWEVSVAAVIEEAHGNKSYWALAHPSDKPDFHHPDSFVLDLP